MTTNIFTNYIPKFIVDLNRNNEDITFVSTSYFDTNGDVYILDTRAVNPVIIQTTQSLQELQPEVSAVYPFKIVVPLDPDGVNVLRIPTFESIPTASQHYYAPIYFERYNRDVLNRIEKSFTELTSFVDEPADVVVEEIDTDLITETLAE
jgi:hypothetical protein